MADPLSNPKASSRNQKRDLWRAVMLGYISGLKKLVGNGADVNIPPAEGRTLIQAAAERGNVGIVKELIKAGADINDPPAEPNGRTALQTATGIGDSDTVHKLILLFPTVDVNAPPANDGGRTACQGTLVVDGPTT
jgi:ankyrin repeat protein